MAELAVIVAGIFTVRYFNSDSYIAKKAWPRFTEGVIQFDYPYSLNPINGQENIDSEYAVVKLYCTDSQGRVATSFNLTFSADKPKPEESLEGAVTNALTAAGASDIEYIEPAFYEDAIVVNLKYKIKGKELNGFAAIYFKDNYYEIVDFLPVNKNYSDKIFDRIMNSIDFVK